jgi:hypothetical protein
VRQFAVGGFAGFRKDSLAAKNAYCRRLSPADMNALKKIIQWEYERGTWQYDAFCLLIIAFIFLTSKSWFN